MGFFKNGKLPKLLYPDMNRLLKIRKKQKGLFDELHKL